VLAVWLADLAPLGWSRKGAIPGTAMRSVIPGGARQVVGFGGLHMREANTALPTMDGPDPLAESSCNQEENKNECIDVDGDHYPGLLGDRNGLGLYAKRLGLSSTGTKHKNIPGR
jgi:hypothetical protein